MVAKSTSYYPLSFIRLALRYIYFDCLLNIIILNWFNRPITVKLNLHFLLTLFFLPQLTHFKDSDLDGCDIPFEHVFNNSSPIFRMENGYTDFDLVFIEVINIESNITLPWCYVLEFLQYLLGNCVIVRQFVVLINIIKLQSLLLFALQRYQQHSFCFLHTRPIINKLKHK